MRKETAAKFTKAFKDEFVRRVVKKKKAEAIRPNEVARANRRWRWQFRYRGSRRESAVAQLFSLGRRQSEEHGLSLRE